MPIESQASACTDAGTEPRLARPILVVEFSAFVSLVKQLGSCWLPTGDPLPSGGSEGLS
jgi:hypothetical protein